ncbi:glycerate kinase [Melissococcus plutonius]|uniref:glycerate kinase n=1 Tax=Melissococcus plutonius TaxID=33970 RepID=UPI003C2E6AC9
MKMNKILIAMDSFKGSATSKEVGEWVKTGMMNVTQNLDISVLSVADGGEGTLDSLIKGNKGNIYRQIVQDPLGRKISARFGMLDKTTAVIEMAEASGITLIEQNESNALRASTFGVGELLLEAIEKGAEVVYIGIGGSATTDGGAGMAQALGVKMLDATGNSIKPGVQGLETLAHISLNEMDKRIPTIKIKILSDVTNPLTGNTGAAAVYGLQKGIPEKMIAEVDKWLENYSTILKKDLGIDIEQTSGSGAAGGLGAGLLAFTNATMTHGIDEILCLLNFEKRILDVDLIITGEGKMDNQSVHGKAPIGIAKIAKAKNIPVIAIVANRDSDLTMVYQAGIDLVLSIIDSPMTLDNAIENVKQHTITTGETAIRAFLLGRKRNKVEKE